MLVYILNRDGKPLMPCSPRQARLLLKKRAAKVVNKSPFTIQLLHGSSGYKQPITLGVDSGYQFIGISAVSEKKEVYFKEPSDFFSPIMVENVTKTWEHWVGNLINDLAPIDLVIYELRKGVDGLFKETANGSSHNSSSVSRKVDI